MTKASPRERIDRGLAHIPGDRQRLGLLMNLPLTDNFIIEVSEKQPISHRGILDQKAIRNFSKKLVADYDIRCETLSQSASTLSGGNQQKLVFSRELSREPTFILAMQPSRGLDVGATEFVHEKLIEQRLNDCAVLLISTELDEIFELSDRISVIYEGRIMATVPREKATRELIGLLMMGKNNAATE